jgi:hypothetical protein
MDSICRVDEIRAELIRRQFAQYAFVFAAESEASDFYKKVANRSKYAGASTLTFTRSSSTGEAEEEWTNRSRDDGIAADCAQSRSRRIRRRRRRKSPRLRRRRREGRSTSRSSLGRYVALHRCIVACLCPISSPSLTLAPDRWDIQARRPHGLRRRQGVLVRRRRSELAGPARAAEHEGDQPEADPEERAVYQGLCSPARWDREGGPD